MPQWRNGLRSRLKICPQLGPGSTPGWGTNARLEELVNSPLFQGGDYGFEAHTEYNFSILEIDSSLTYWYNKI